MFSRVIKMESINNKQSQDDFTKAHNRYLELKWKIMFKDYTNKKEQEQILSEMSILEMEWQFQDDENQLI